MANENDRWASRPDAVATTAHSALVASFGPASLGSKQAVSQADPLRLSVAKLYCYAAGHAAPVGAATGVFISDRTLLTSGHVLFNQAPFGGYAAHVQIWSPWFPIPPVAAMSEWIVVPPEAEHQNEPPPDLDIGIVRLKGAVPGSNPLVPVAASDAALAGADLRIYGYGEYESQLQAAAATAAGSPPQLIYYEADLQPGDSGSPVLAASAAGPALVGVHRAGKGAIPENPQFASAFRFTPPAIDWIHDTLVTFGG